jgi:SAM-dependent MidA family methyltransferase
VLGVTIEIAFDVLGEAFAQYFSAVLEILSQTALLHENLIVRRTERYQRDANDERDDKSGAK